MEVAVCFTTLGLVLVFSISSGKAFKGIKMCQRDCRETGGCMSIHYDPVHLECRLLFHVKETVETTTTAVTQSVTKRNTVQDILRKCTENQRLIHTRQTTLACVQTEAPEEEFVQPHLLLHRADTLLKTAFGSDMYEELHFPSWKIGCVAYWKREKRLLLGVDKEIISTPITIKKRTLVKRIGAENIFIDEEANFIFVKPRSKVGKRICRMTVAGKQLKVVMQRPDNLDFLIDIDRKRKLIYVTNCFSLQTFTYNGTKTGRFNGNFETAIPVVMVYNQREDVIYFHTGSNTVFKQRNDTQILVTFPLELYFFPLRSMAVHGKYLYISDCHGKILRLDCTEQSKEEIRQIPRKYWNAEMFPVYSIYLMLPY